MKKSNRQKYLAQYAETEVHSLRSFPCNMSFQHVVLVPAYKETNAFVTSFLDNSFNEQSALMVLVINQPESSLDTALQEILHEQINGVGTVQWQSENLSLLSFEASNNKILVVDKYFTYKIPDKFGVGLARKIGADIALALKDKGAVSSDWICSTDADSTLPVNYFDALSGLSNNEMAACFNFHHTSEDKAVNQANALYEQALRYYVAGLQYAGSKYAFFTIGSALAFHNEAYANVRGFPKKSAGEDFYLLNKIAKLGRISFIEDSVIQIVARESDRVPFGTGPAVSKIMALAKEKQPYCYYHPRVFETLKDCLTAFDDLYHHRQEIDHWLQNQSSIVATALINIGFVEFVNKHKNHKETQFSKQLDVWFDAFKTLKFIHEVRESAFPNIPLTQALHDSIFL